MGIKRNTIIVLFLITLGALAVIIYAVPGVTGLLVETYTAEYGELSIHDDTTGYFVRDEIVYGANSSGTVNRLADEGDLLRPHTTVIEISEGASNSTVNQVNGESQDDPENADPLTEIKNKLGSAIVTTSDYRLETGGIVSFYVDGYEKTFILDSVGEINRQRLENVKQGQVVDIGSETSKGNPVFKIIDNRRWIVIAYVPGDHRENYIEGEDVKVTFFEKGDNESEFMDLSDSDPLFNRIDMTIESVVREGDYAKLILSSIRYFEGIGEYRVCGCRIESKDVRGLLIENDSIAEVDGITGVYVKNKTGKYNFTPIKIYGSSDSTTVIADTYFYDDEGNYTKTVDPFDDVLREPEDAAA